MVCDEAPGHYEALRAAYERDFLLRSLTRTYGAAVGGAQGVELLAQVILAGKSGPSCGGGLLPPTTVADFARAALGGQDITATPGEHAAAARTANPASAVALPGRRSTIWYHLAAATTSPRWGLTAQLPALANVQAVPTVTTSRQFLADQWGTRELVDEQVPNLANAHGSV